MRDVDLIADLRRYMAEEIPADIARKALSQAMTEVPPGGGSIWLILIMRAAHIIRQRR